MGEISEGALYGQEPATGVKDLRTSIVDYDGGGIKRRSRHRPGLKEWRKSRSNVEVKSGFLPRDGDYADESRENTTWKRPGNLAALVNRPTSPDA